MAEEMKGNDEMKERYHTVMTLFGDDVQEMIDTAVDAAEDDCRCETWASALKNIMASLGWGTDEAMDTIGVPKDKRERVLALL